MSQVDESPNVAPPKRGPIACRRCRRLRSKCINDQGEGVAPCRGCKQSGRADECVFVKGNSVVDRKDAPRPTKRPRQQSLPGLEALGDSPNDAPHIPLSAAECGPYPPTRIVDTSPQENDEWSRPFATPSSINTLFGQGKEEIGANKTPTKAELEQAISVFFYSFYQVGFLHKATILRRIREPSSNLSPFLIAAILSLTARGVPSLVQKGGGSQEQACRYWKDRALAMLADECMTPSLECIQALYLLGLNDWGSGCGARSWMLIGMGLRMVELLRLERKETYRASGTSTPVDQVEAESSRRTVWSLLIADDSLAVGCGSSPANKLDVTIATPCDEDDWDFGSIPSIITPETASRSMMGNTISAMSLWSRAARWASAVERGDSLRIPWDPHSEFTEIDRLCREFIVNLSPRLAYSPTTLAAHRSRKMDMALVHLHLVHHGTHMLLRRMHMPVMLASALNPAAEGTFGGPTSFWRQCAEQACRSAIETIDISAEYVAGWDTSMPMGFSPLMCFVVFLAGTMMSHLHRWPALMPQLAAQSRSKTISALQLLTRLQDELPAAGRWLQVLNKLESASSSASMLQPTRKRSTRGDQGDPLEMLTDLVSSQPYNDVAPLLSPETQSIQTNNTTDAGLPWNSDFYDSFGISNTDLADLFGFAGTDFGNQLNPSRGDYFTSGTDFSIS